MGLFERMFEKAAARVGLVRRRVAVRRGSGIAYENRWVRPVSNQPPTQPGLFDETPRQPSLFDAPALHSKHQPEYPKNEPATPRPLSLFDEGEVQATPPKRRNTLNLKKLFGKKDNEPNEQQHVPRKKIQPNNGHSTFSLFDADAGSVDATKSPTSGAVAPEGPTQRPSVSAKREDGGQSVGGSGERDESTGRGASGVNNVPESPSVKTNAPAINLFGVPDELADPQTFLRGLYVALLHHPLLAPIRRNEDQEAPESEQRSAFDGAWSDVLGKFRELNPSGYSEISSDADFLHRLKENTFDQVRRALPSKAKIEFQRKIEEDAKRSDDARRNAPADDGRDHIKIEDAHHYEEVNGKRVRVRGEGEPDPTESVASTPKIDLFKEPVNREEAEQNWDKTDQEFSQAESKPYFESRGLQAQVQSNETDYSFTADTLNIQSNRKQASNNFAAIDLVRQLDEEQRLPTLEEKEVLARYVGWGSFGQAFHPAVFDAFERALRRKQRDAASPDDETIDGLSWDEISDYLPHDMQGDTWRNRIPLSKELYQKLSATERDEAWQSARTAFYTPPSIVNEIWGAVRRLGAGKQNTLNILEPGCGSGNFLGLQPADLKEKSKRVGVELDGFTGKIAQYLYPNAQIHIKGFQEVRLQDNKFDVVIGNPPFGSTAIFDPEFNKAGKEPLTKSLHGYFIAKSIDKLKPGGVLGFVISRQFLDASDGKNLRDYIDSQAHFLGAVRMPSDAFMGNSGTSVTTDLVFFQKKNPEFEALHPRGADGRFVKKWTDTTEVEIHNHHNEDYPYKVGISEYFAAHPENMLGKLSTSEGMYNYKDFGLKREGFESHELTQKVHEALQRILPEDIMPQPSGGDVYSEQQQKAEEIAKDAPDHVKMGAYHITEDGTVTRNIGGRLIPVVFRETKDDPGGARAKKRLAGMIGIRDAIVELNAAEVADKHTQALDILRTNLNKVYDAFVKEFAPLHEGKNLRAFAGRVGQLHDKDNVRTMLGDPDAGLLLALEEKAQTPGADGKPQWDGVSWKKAEIFEKRIISPNRRPDGAESIEDAYGISLNEFGGINWARMSALMRAEPEKIRDDLAAKGLIFRDPNQADDEETQGWVTHDEYLTGNVREKLEDAKAAAEHDSSYRRNVIALEAVQPPRVAAGDIDYKLGAAWIPKADYEEFAKHLIGRPMWGGVENLLSYNPISSKWYVDTLTQKDTRKTDTGNTKVWGTEYLSGLDLLSHAMNGTEPTVKKTIRDENNHEKEITDGDATFAAREKVRKIKEEFSSWFLSDGERASRAADIYNDLYNTNRLREFDGSHLTLPGMATEIASDLRKHVKDFVWRVIQEGTALADHCVGAGKTRSGAASCMELRRLGLAKKPMIVVPCSLVPQWEEEFRSYYPGAKVLTVWAKDWTPDKRKEMTSRIATGDWDAVIISHTAFGDIPLSEEMVKSHFNEEISELRSILSTVQMDEAGNKKGKSRTANQIESMIETAKVNLKSRLAKVQEQQDHALPWEQLGVDTVIVDELHMFKNLRLVSRHTRLPGLGGVAGSDRAMDLFLKTQHVQKKNNGRGFIGMTGTPVSNSLTEMYTLMRYFMRPRLKKLGMGQLDAWLQTFANIETAMEAAPEGGYRERSRVRDFSNIPEMTRMYREFADVRTADDLKLPVPELHGGAPENVVADQSNTLTSFMQDLRERALQLTGQRGQVPDPKDDNFLKMMSDARKASLDMRLVPGYESAEDDPNSKVNLCVNNVLEDYKASHGYSGTQMVFLDMSTPKGAVEGAEHPHVTAAGAVAYNMAINDGKSEKEAQAAAKDAKKTKKDEIAAQAKSRKLEAKSGAMQARDEAEAEARENGLSAKEIRDAGKAAHEEYLKTFEAENDDPNRVENPDEIELEDEAEQKQKFQVYGDIKNKLIAQGIPEHEIAFIHDYQTDAKKNELRERMNSGSIRVLLGSTGKMGAGLNAQERLYSLHHLDCPWKPADLEQREGRIIRQGNKHLKMGIPVRIRRYATKGSLDEFMWQQIENKAKFIRQARTGAVEGRRMEDIGEAEMQAAAMKVASSDSPELARLTEAKIQKARLDSLYRSHVNERDEWRNTTQTLPAEIARHNGMATKHEAHAEIHQAHAAQRDPKKPFQMQIGDETFENREDAGKRLKELHRKLTRDDDVPHEGVPVGQYGPFKMHVMRNVDPFTMHNKFRVNLVDSSGAHVASASEGKDELTGSGVTSSLDHVLRSLPKMAAYHRDQAASKGAQLDDLHKRLNSADSWEHADAHDKLKREIALLEARQRVRRKAQQLGKSKDEIEAEVANVNTG